MGGTTRRPAAVVLALALAVSGCAQTVAGRASPADPSTAGSSSAPTVPVPLPAPAPPTPTGVPVDEATVCLVVGFGLIEANSLLLDWLAAVDAGQPPPVPAEEVARAYDRAVVDARPVVDGAPPGAVRDAAGALLAAATALAADLRAGGRGADAGLVPASDALDAACPD